MSPKPLSITNLIDTSFGHVPGIFCIDIVVLLDFIRLVPLPKLFDIIALMNIFLAYAGFVVVPFDFISSSG